MRSDPADSAALADPGVDQLMRILTAGPTRAEMAGEQRALAMFRANASPASASPASASAARGRPAAGADATVPIPAWHPAAEPRWPVRNPFRRSAHWGVRLAAAAAVAVAAGMGAAAYAAALPAPVQDLAHRVLGFAGVPEAHQHQAGPGRAHGSQPGAPGGQSGAPSGGAAQPSRSARPSASPSSSSSTVTSPTVLSASASSAVIAAGTQPVIDGRLTRAGTGINGVTVTLVERRAGHPFWRVAGTGQTSSTGNVAVTGLPLATDAVLQLRIAGGVHSASVRVTVTPQVNVVLTVGSAGLRDLLTVRTRYAQRGDVVWLQAQSADGSWVGLRTNTLDTAGKTAFVVSGTRLKNKKVRVVLVATARHGRADSNSVLVPPPS